MISKTTYGVWNILGLLKPANVLLINQKFTDIVDPSNYDLCILLQLGFAFFISAQQLELMLPILLQLLNKCTILVLQFASILQFAAKLPERISCLLSGKPHNFFEITEYPLTLKNIHFLLTVELFLKGVLNGNQLILPPLLSIAGNW